MECILQAGRGLKDHGLFFAALTARLLYSVDEERKRQDVTPTWLREKIKKSLKLCRHIHLILLLQRNRACLTLFWNRRRKWRRSNWHKVFLFLLIVILKQALKKSSGKVLLINFESKSINTLPWKKLVMKIIQTWIQSHNKLCQTRGLFTTLMKLTFQVSPKKESKHHNTNKSRSWSKIKL